MNFKIGDQYVDIHNGVILTIIALNEHTITLEGPNPFSCGNRIIGLSPNDFETWVNMSWLIPALSVDPSSFINHGHNFVTYHGFEYCTICNERRK